MAFDRETGKRVEPDTLMTYTETLAQYHLRPEAKFLNGEHTDTGRTERRHVVATTIIHIGKEANKWEEQYFLGDDEDAGIEYEAGAAHEAINANVRRLVRELGERSAADELTISRTALRKILVEGAGSSSRVTLRKIAQRQFGSSLVERTVGK